MRLIVEDQSCTLFNFSIFTVALMVKLTSTSSDSSISGMPGFAFRWGFTACAVVAPLALVAYAFASFPDAIDRAHFVLQGLETIVFALGVKLIVAAYYRLAVTSDPRHLIRESASVNLTTSA